ncbi:antitoxin PaaA2 family protein [Pseudoduganella aquatica]|uniref:Stability determinant domain-containing protein n=1 Tax=Pseudoduganella aquatica TaxID=2660641 RepID=A0A7X4H749_9BURK|nr:hypothetical protein [Pseudoduganella aquatica]MYN05943.1 hypothetical protein [Pseudoduganella aquatica]
MTAGSKNSAAPAVPPDSDASYDEWLAAEVDDAIHDPRPSIPNDEVKRYFAAKREVLKKRIKGD